MWQLFYKNNMVLTRTDIFLLLITAVGPFPIYLPFFCVSLPYGPFPCLSLSRMSLSRMPSSRVSLPYLFLLCVFCPRPCLFRLSLSCLSYSCVCFSPYVSFTLVIPCIYLSTMCVSFPYVYHCWTCRSLTSITFHFIVGPHVWCIFCCNLKPLCVHTSGKNIRPVGLDGQGF